MDNKNINDDVIEIESNWYIILKEILIFFGVTFILYCTYFITTLISSIVYMRYSTMNRIEEEMSYQASALERYNATHRIKSTEIVVTSQMELLKNDLKYSKFSIYLILLLTPIALCFIYLFFTQLNLRSRIRIPTTILSFVLVVTIYFIEEFNTLLQEGESLLFIINCIVPFIVSFFLCLFVLLTPKNGKFSYYN